MNPGLPFLLVLLQTATLVVCNLGLNHAARDLDEANFKGEEAGSAADEEVDDDDTRRELQALHRLDGSAYRFLLMPVNSVRSMLVVGVICALGQAFCFFLILMYAVDNFDPNESSMCELLGFDLPQSTGSKQHMQLRMGMAAVWLLLLANRASDMSTVGWMLKHAKADKWYMLTMLAMLFNAMFGMFVTNQYALYIATSAKDTMLTSSMTMIIFNIDKIIFKFVKDVHPGLVGVRVRKDSETELSEIADIAIVDIE